MRSRLGFVTMACALTLGSIYLGACFEEDEEQGSDGSADAARDGGLDGAEASTGSGNVEAGLSDLDGGWEAAPHFIVVGTRGAAPFRVTARPPSEQLGCTIDRGAGVSRPDIDVIATGALEDGIGTIRLKLKDYDVPTATVGERAEQDKGIRIEWELKDPSGTSLCEQNATAGSLRFEAVPKADGDLFGATLEATIPEGDGCPAAQFEASFSVTCTIEP